MFQVMVKLRVNGKDRAGGSFSFRQIINNVLLRQRVILLTASNNEEEVMLWTICVVLIVLWLLGMVTAYTMGGLIHILLVVAVISVLVRVIQGRRVL